MKNYLAENGQKRTNLQKKCKNRLKPFTNGLLGNLI